MWEPPGGMPPSKGVPVATKDCTEISHKKTNTFLKRQMIRKKKQILHKKTKDCVETLESESGQGILKASDHIYHIIA